ncbi:uncharacterized protein [Halyomorpha halys]|uniref:uncharacterized protein n=1 Tax=Halyomorpha halys TaxID=286706 RepID=UPI0006D4F735|nr:uncharacterized protein LOC106689212 [Halyomorpha halys]XP_014289581.1 uncharacterized protein LOC106689212 [Halyomorpha halys]XP_014289582.1 uncharacterized protein LOC106689212 [Halyomorpha halys]XP_014289583.1 uncharacterized protein LOC106689212 [Halyomorpha halys]
MSKLTIKLQEFLAKVTQNKTKGEIMTNESLKSWLRVTEQNQDFYCSTLGTRTWEQYRQNEKHFLKLKLGFAIFGPPSHIDDNDISFKDPIQSEIIENIQNVIEKVSESENIYLAFIYLIGNVDGEYAEFPIIRILKESDDSTKYTSYFVDILGRLYKNWDAFLNDNIFPKCVYCYPKNGFYSRDKDGNVQLDLAYSPTCKKLKRFVKGADILSDAAMVGSLAIGLTSLAVPVAAPVLIGSAVAGVSSGVWTSARGATSLIDRKKHGQPLDISKKDARNDWLTLVSGILGAAGAGAMHYSQLVARSGQVLSKVPRIVMSTIETGCSISCGSLYIINQIMNVIENKELTSFDSAQLALSFLFYFHTNVNAKSISKILLKLQKDVILDIKKHLDSQQKSIIEYILKEGQKQTTEGRGEIVKSLTILDDVDDIIDLFRKEQEKFSIKSPTNVLTYNEAV